MTVKGSAMNQHHQSPSSKFNLLLLAGLLILCYGVAAVGGFATYPEIKGWYAGIKKPAWNPPNEIFGPVWSFLYFTVALSGWMVFKRIKISLAHPSVRIYALQLALNLMWSFVFFKFHQIFLAFVDIIALWFSIGVMIAVFCRIRPLAAWLLLPYFLWVSFAAVLNYAIWQLN